MLVNIQTIDRTERGDAPPLRTEDSEDKFGTTDNDEEYVLHCCSIFKSNVFNFSKRI